LTALAVQHAILHLEAIAVKSLLDIRYAPGRNAGSCPVGGLVLDDHHYQEKIGLNFLSSKDLEIEFILVYAWQKTAIMYCRLIMFQ